MWFNVLAFTKFSRDLSHPGLDSSFIHSTTKIFQSFLLSVGSAAIAHHATMPLWDTSKRVDDDTDVTVGGREKSDDGAAVKDISDVSILLL